MKLAFLTLVLIVLANCDAAKLKSSGGELNPTQIPKNLDKQSPVGQKLGDKEMTVLRLLVVKTAALPDPKLILGPKDESDLDKKIRTDLLATLPLSARNNLQKILTNCAPSLTKDVSGEKKAGAVQMISFKEAMTGSNCPLQFGHEKKYRLNWVAVNENSAISMASYAGTIENKAFVLNPDFARESQIQNMTYRLNIAGAIKNEANQQARYEIATGDRVITLVGYGTSTTRSKTETLTKVENGTTTTEKVISLNINMRSFTFLLWNYTQRTNGELKEQTMFINGEPVSPNEFADLLKGF